MVGHAATALKSMVVGFAVVVASLTMLLYSATDMFLVSTGLGWKPYVVGTKKTRVVMYVCIYI